MPFNGNCSSRPAHHFPSTVPARAALNYQLLTYFSYPLFWQPFLLFVVWFALLFESLELVGYTMVTSDVVSESPTTLAPRTEGPKLPTDLPVIVEESNRGEVLRSGSSDNEARQQEETQRDEINNEIKDEVSLYDSLLEPSRALDEDEMVKILGEVVAGYRLGGDKQKLIEESDMAEQEDVEISPYCILKFGNSIVHRTKEVDGLNNPIWTISKQSLFLFEASPRELAQHDLHVSVWYKERDPLKLTTLCTFLLGKATIDASQILSTHGNEELLDVQLTSEDGRTNRGTLTLRFRLAGPSDEAFLKRIAPKKKPNQSQRFERILKKGDSSGSLLTSLPKTKPIAPLVTEMDETQLAGTNFVNAISSAFTTKTIADQSSGERKKLVKPFPDPKRVKETTYMTPKQIEQDAFLPSHEWVEAGSGGLGKLYLEILSCDDLPNVDVGESVGNFTDCFICAIFEDSVVQTPVIDDELSPRWLPWTQRAFCINIMHPASILYLGAFDFDLGPLQEHDPLGRVAINVSNLQRNTDFTLTYNLYPSSNIIDRTSAGSVTVRIRVEYKDEKEALMACLRPRPKFHVNVSKEKSLKVVRYTCHGEYGDEDDQQFDLTVTRSYVNEILSYKKNLSYCFGDAFRSLVFWRGQVRVMNILVPLHSFLFFCASCHLVERPYLAPPFFLLGVAWIMLATLTQRRQHPSPWNRCPSFWNYLEILFCGESSVPIKNIQANEGLEETEAYERERNDRLERDLKDAATRAARQAHIDSIGDESIHTKMQAGIPLDLLKRLTRYQGMIARYCRYLRFIKIIVTWEESIVSFWITACFLAAGLVSLLLPWAFILTWTSRLVVWGLLGPHMMIVDALINDNSKEEKSLAEAIEKFKSESRSARIRRQEAVKLRDIKCLTFGKYVTLVPSFNLSSHYDRPLPSSFAVYQGDEKEESITWSKYSVPGQQFFGVIVPRTEVELQQYKKELPVLEEMRVSVDRCVQDILESESCELLKRLKMNMTSREERNMPRSVGYEMISLDDSSHWDRGLGSITSEEGREKSEEKSPIQLSASRTIELNFDEQVALLQSTNRRGSSMVTESEVLVMSPADDGAENVSVPISTLSSIQVSHRKLAIVPTREERRSSLFSRRLSVASSSQALAGMSTAEDNTVPRPLIAEDSREDIELVFCDEDAPQPKFENDCVVEEWGNVYIVSSCRT